jgi:hypothetical protein
LDAIRRRWDTRAVLCALTGAPHRLFWLRSAWFCEDCRQKIETCCEGDCPSSAPTALAVPNEPNRSEPGR